MKHKYKCYPLFDKIFIFVLLLFFAGIFVLCSDDEEFIKSLPIFVPVFLVLFVCFFCGFLRTVEVSDTEITADIWAFFKKRTIRVSDIVYFRVFKERSLHVLFLGLPDKNGKPDALKIVFFDKRFIEQMTGILRKRFAKDIQKAKEEMKADGIHINASHRKLKFDEKGIENLKTHDFFPWNEVTASVEQTKKGKKYIFTIDKTVNFELARSYFLFQLEDLLDDYSTLCGEK